MSQFFDELEQRLRASAEAQHAVPIASSARRGRWWRSHRRLLAVAVLTGLVGAAVPAVSAVTGLWAPDVQPQRPWGTVEASAGAHGFSCDTGPTRIDVGPPAGKEFTSVLGVLGRPRTAADQIALKYLRPLRLQGVDVTGIRYVGTAADGQRNYLIPARGFGATPWPARCLRGVPPAQRRALAHPPQRREPIVCLFSRGGGCGPLRDIREHGQYGSGGAVRGRATITGLAPNGVTAVRVTYGHSTRTFPVRHNFFTFKMGIDVEQASSPDRLEWIMQDGTVRDVTR